MKLAPYPKYKDSGIEWLGEIPEGWEIRKLRYISKSVKTGTTPPSENYEYYDEGNMDWYTPGDFGEKLELVSSFKKITDLAIKKRVARLFEKGTILLVGIGATLGKVALLNKEASSNQQINAIVLNEHFIPKFYAYYLNAIKDTIISFSNAATLGIINQEKTKQITCIIPTKPEQIFIVSYLDHKTSQLDDLIKKNEKLTELLKENRQAIISHAVTKGLDPDAKMKDSGIEWIGEIPEGWEAKKIKHTSYVKGRIGWHGLRSDEFTDEGPYLVTGTDFIGDKLNWETCYHISDARYNEDPYIQLQKDDLLITKDGTIGKVALVKNLPDKATLNSGIMLIRPITEDYRTHFMFWILNSKIFSEYIEYTKTGSTVQHLYQETFEKFIFPVPHIDEQKSICTYLIQKTTQIDESIKNIQSQNETLKEYRQTLISNVVTGKVKVY